MADYLKDKATRILATNCCCCGLPLRDAKSVELGVGPVCRDKHGFNHADVPTTPEMAKRALGIVAVSGLEDVAVNTVVDRYPDARSMCNWLVYYASANYADKDVVLSCTPIIRQLGYTTLAGKLERDRSGIRFEYEGNEIHVYCPRNNDFIRGAHRLSGRITRHEESGRFKCWTFLAEYKDALIKLLEAVFSGEGLFDGDHRVQLYTATWDEFQGSCPLRTQRPAPKPVDLSSKFTITMNGKHFLLESPYDAKFVSDLRKVRSRRWDSLRKVNSFSVNDLQRVKDICHKHFGVTL
jgi:hypothetical protein